MWAGGVAALNADGRGRRQLLFMVSVLSYFILFTFMLESRSLLLFGFLFFDLSPFFCNSDIINTWWLNFISLSCHLDP